MTPFEREVIERLTRIETNQEHRHAVAKTLTARVDKHDDRLNSLEALKGRVWLMAGIVGVAAATIWEWLVGKITFSTS